MLVEEFLDGQEVSLFLLSDGTNVLPLSPAQDYKRLRDGDAGPEHGRHGRVLAAAVARRAVRQRAGVRRRGHRDHRTARPCASSPHEQTPFIGLLYAGLILTSRGIRVIEFNARFGDPETQVVLPRLATPLSGLLYAAATGRLAEHPRPEFRADAAVTVVLASEGYPEAPETGRRLDGLDEAASVPGVHLAHAATAIGRSGENGDPTPHLVATGGRVLNVVAVGDDFAEARRRAYEALGHLRLEGGQYRTDIAARVAGVTTASAPRHPPFEGRTVMTDTGELAGWTHVYSGKVRDLYVPTAR